MKLENVESNFKQRLEAAKIDLNTPNIQEVWAIFKEFVKEPIETVPPFADILMFECGVFPFYGPENFTASFVRQSFLGVEEYNQYLWQFHCVFTYKLRDELKTFQDIIHFDQEYNYEKFFADVENSSVFRLLATSQFSARLDIFTEAI
jgi:hypothetical protein